GVLPRLDVLIIGLDDELAHRQVNGKWSIAQNIGHLSDVEELWEERLEDLMEFRGRRSHLVGALAGASPELQRAAAFHERLQISMRLVDCAQFYAEHDDHHLIRIRRLRSMLGLDAG